MQRHRITVLGVAVTATIALMAPGASASTATMSAQPRVVMSAQPRAAGSSEHVGRVCPSAVRAGHATCLAERVLGKNRPASAGPPSAALTPAQLRDAYHLEGAKSGGRTVAIIDAYGYPDLEADLATYRSYFGLPACTTADGCLTVMDQRGGSSQPPFNLDWAVDQALDVDAVSAACPDCKILVVQADANSFANLGQAVVTAAAQPGVVAISNSYAAADVNDSQLGHYYDHPGIAVTASTGDMGDQGGAYPASSHYVVAVGGTSLSPVTANPATHGRRWTETAWGGAGSGCSVNQRVMGARQVHTGCGRFRAMADVSAAADPVHGGLACFVPTSETQSTWAQIGGTSESAPIIASVYALSGNTAGLANTIPYADREHLYDVTVGSNGSGCTPTQLCNARKGWDGPTGLGTPNGVKSF